MTVLADLYAETFGAIPKGTSVIDAHTHLGLDEDGFALTPEALIESLDEIGPDARACTFPLHDPDRNPAYRVPNDRVLAAAAASDGRLIPYCRLDPADGAAQEAERCLAIGARGIKLHPRAQSFGFGSEVAADIFGVARDAGVPILIHAGRGMPPMDSLAELALRFPEVPLVLAHAGIAGQGMFASRLAGHPSVLYDTSTLSPTDVVELYARVAAERIVFASDIPYGRPTMAMFACLRIARLAGLDDDDLRMLLGGTMATVLAGESLPPKRPPRLPENRLANGRLARVEANVMLAFGGLMGSGLDPAAALPGIALARCVARDPDAGAVSEELAQIDELLAQAEVEFAQESMNRVAAFALLHAVAVMATTHLPTA